MDCFISYQVDIVSSGSCVQSVLLPGPKILFARSTLHGVKKKHLPDWGLAMSVSPKDHHNHHQHHSGHQQSHSTPFYVTNILSPIEEGFKKVPLSPESPFQVDSPSPISISQQQQHYWNYSNPTDIYQNTMNPPGSNHHYSHISHVPQLSHHPSAAGTFTAAQYCNGSDIPAHYGDPVRQSAGTWYGANPDPRLTCK